MSKANTHSHLTDGTAKGGAEQTKDLLVITQFKGAKTWPGLKQIQCQVQCSHHLQQPQPRGGVTALLGKKGEANTANHGYPRLWRPGIKTSVHSWKLLLWPSQCLFGLLMSQLPMFKYWEILHYNPE